MGLLERIFQAIRSRATSVIDAAPPYRRIEGRLTAKEATPDGLYYVLINDDMVEVDWLTFDTLLEGEALRIRATRAYKAINIDRLSP